MIKKNSPKHVFGDQVRILMTHQNVIVLTMKPYKIGHLKQKKAIAPLLLISEQKANKKGSL